MRRKNKFLLYFIILIVCSNSSNIYSQDTTVLYSLIKRTDSGFLMLKKNIRVSEIRNNFSLKYLYIDSTLRSISFLDSAGNLYDGTYSNALTIFEYDNNVLKYKKMFDKSGRRVNDPFLGYSSIEFLYDNLGRIIKEIYREKNDSIIKYLPNIDFIPPFFEYVYLKDKCLRKWLDNNNRIQFIDTCNCPKIKVKLNK